MAFSIATWRMVMVEATGFLSVCFMVLFYALEDKAPIFTFAFAGACLCAAIYAFLIGSFPFMVAEGIWSLITVRKWTLRSLANL
ncbi:MAG: hypothetical protein AAF871_16690 [Pseudomonadota bacterium]